MKSEKKLKKALLFAWVSNTTMWVIEIIMGIVSNSSSLILDALDFLFDGANYFSSIYALDKSEKLKTLFGKTKGWIMVLTGIIIFIWILYKYLNGWIPNGFAMSIIGVCALWVNIISTFLISKYQNESLDIQAVWLCTRNDALNNVLIIIAGILTVFLSSIYPDILVSIWMGSLAIFSGIKIVNGGNPHGHKH